MLEDGLRQKWVPVDVAIKLMMDVKPVSKLGLSIKKRDLFFVENFAAVDLLSSFLGLVFFIM